MTNTVDGIIPFFRSERWTKHRGLDVAIVGCDRERPRDNTGLIGETVIIDRSVYVVRAVERHLPATPISCGELIGLHVEPYYI